MLERNDIKNIDERNGKGEKKYYYLHKKNGRRGEQGRGTFPFVLSSFGNGCELESEQKEMKAHPTHRTLLSSLISTSARIQSLFPLSSSLTSPPSVPSTPQQESFESNDDGGGEPTEEGEWFG